jgi:hypothetical protein
MKHKIFTNQVEESLFNFLHNIDSLNETVPLTMVVIGEMLKKSHNDHKKFLEKNGVLEKTVDGESTYTLHSRYISDERKITRKIDQNLTAVDLMPRNFLVSFVSEYDAFLGGLIKGFYTKKAELLNGLDRQISFSELVSFSSLENAKEFILEKEVENILRKSHCEHFDILERKFNIKLRKDLEIWPTFIELMERRNLFVHCDGIVSSQYITVCNEHNVPLSDAQKLGTRLTVDPSYLKEASSTLREIAIKLSHVLWRKIFPEERLDADQSLLQLTYELIQQERLSLAIKILEFSIALPKHFDDNFKRMFVINLAQAYKYSENNKKCIELIASHDWSSVAYKFKLAVSVLSEKYTEAADYMVNAALTNELTEQNYLEWPLFKEFRKTSEFADAFFRAYKKQPPEKEAITITSSESSITTHPSKKIPTPPKASRRTRSAKKQENE